MTSDDAFLQRGGASLMENKSIRDYFDAKSLQDGKREHQTAAPRRTLTTPDSKEAISGLGKMEPEDGAQVEFQQHNYWV
eukprot:CAMPEP_0114512026 /NCGR_PEP_ID=MMETSP0109-20121206/14736_1 /TAXON_ID=29199 /ORGANISM="Chlorarachnion reptans, Strain CCCM449" /LENGTH=78 /DNA_ID=CAMNT_0001691643 /DNA_START=156 /DNA_END=392 /DNA_ORIENTATION=+